MRPASFPLVLAGLVAAVSAPGAAAAAEPIAIVEQAHGVPRLEALDYLSAGQAIELGTDGVLVVDYLRSCVRESIEGGSVKVGKEQSTVGRLLAWSACGSTATMAAATQSPMLRIIRAAPASFSRSSPRASRTRPASRSTIYSTSPLFDMGGPAPEDRGARPARQRHRARRFSAGELKHGRFYDFAAAGKRLEAGGLYRASARGQSVVFWIDPLAHEAAGPPGGQPHPSLIPPEQRAGLRQVRWIFL